MSMVVVLGSGETAPTMVKTHRQVLAETAGRRGGPAVMLDTPFGFQLNADDLVRRIRQYFAESVGTPIEVAGWRRADQPVIDRDRALALLHRASWVFAGPGSPTYALRQWRGTGVPDALLDVAARGGTLVFGSAAACTFGTHAIPVYEIYKVGEEPRWEPGLDLLGRLTGLAAVVVPHYDNAEGRGHDTRFCYLGQRRLSLLEAELPEPVGVLGVDEHTALLIDVEARTARVAGNGAVTVRRRGVSRGFPAGTELGLDDLDAALRGRSPTGAGSPAPPGSRPHVPGPTGSHGTAGATAGTSTSLREETRRAERRFETALADRDVDGCVTAVLQLQTAIVAWSSDTRQSDDTDRAHRTLRALVVRLGELARLGARDPRKTVEPFVELLLGLRDRARADRDYPTADLIRSRLVAAGVEVQDTPGGTLWLLGHPSGRAP